MSESGYPSSLRCRRLAGLFVNRKLGGWRCRTDNVVIERRGIHMKTRDAVDLTANRLDGHLDGHSAQ